MLSLFPNLLSYPLLAYFILRLIVVWGIGCVAMSRWKKPSFMTSRSIAVLELVSGVFITLGLYTQGALLAAVILFIIDFVLDVQKGTATAEQRRLTVIISLIAVALLFTGPGAFAIDLPL